MFEQYMSLMRAYLEGRSPKWPALERKWIKAHPYCAVCGKKETLQVHHKIPYHVDPTKELDETNLITLCNPGQGGCHLLFGHLGHWESWNVTIEVDVLIWSTKIGTRPFLPKSSGVKL